MSDITIIKRDGSKEPFDANKINIALMRASEGLPDQISKVVQVASELRLTLFDGMTAEYGNELARIVRKDGLVVANLIAGLNNAPCRELFAAFDAVYRRTWPHAWYAAQHRDLSRGNYVIAYSKKPRTMPAAMSPLRSLGGTLYTDNFIPNDRLYEACRRAAR